MMMTRDTSFKGYQKGDKVWLDAKNLKTTHPTHKLRAKRYGPFKVSDVISHVAYQLQIPPSWKIHNIFHTSYLSPYKETREYGPNFLEPPPDIIGGEPEWEVEAIIGMRHFGQKRKKQYCIRWKGYSEAHDTWEPEDNIHAPELIAQYHQGQGMHIRATGLKVTSHMQFFKEHLLFPEELPTVPEPASAATEKSDKFYTEALARVKLDHVKTELPKKLEQLAQHRQEQEEQAKFAASVPSLGTKATGNQSSSRLHLRKNIPRPGSPHHRGQGTTNPKQGGGIQHVLQHPLVKDIEKMADSTTRRDENSGEVPDPPWFAKPNQPDIPALTVNGPHGQLIELPYMHYALIDENPMLLGIEKKNGAIYGENLQAVPYAGSLPYHINDSELEWLYTDYPFNWSQQLALYNLGDAGIIADVHRYRTSYLKLQLMCRENERLSNILTFA